MAQPIDVAKYLADGADEAMCKEVAKQFHELGVLVIKDPRVTFEDNGTFIDMMEKYFGQSQEAKDKDIRKEFFYQVGTTPNDVENARNHCSKIEKIENDDDKPLTSCPPGVDPKWRFFWRMGEHPPTTEFARLNAEPVIPAAFPEWPKVMDRWGSLILATVHTIAEMAARGFDLPADSFTNLMKYGPHLLAPTGSDLVKHEKKGTVFAKYHYDLNFMTIHGKSRFPGLYVWTREGKKVQVKVPDGCLLIQAGKQLEYLTGGEVLAGFHEVVVADGTLDKIEVVKKSIAEGGKGSLWRVSSTLFSHIASDNELKPLGKFATPEALEKFPPIKAGNQVQAELAAIKLGSSE